MLLAFGDGPLNLTLVEVKLGCLGVASLMLLVAL